MTQAQSKNKILVFIIFLLLVTNILVVAYFLYFCKKQPPKNRSKDTFATLLQKEVGFSQQQVDSFNKLKQSHWEQAKKDMSKIVDIKNTIFDYTKQENTPDSVIEKLADSIGLLQKKVEVSAYYHVVATRKICTPEQRPVYDSIMKKIINKGRFGKPGKNAPPPPPPVV